MGERQYIRISIPIVAVMLILQVMISITAAGQEPSVGPATIINGTFMGETPPLRDLTPISPAQWAIMVEKAASKMNNPDLKHRSYPFASTALPKGPDPVWQNTMGLRSDSKVPVQTFDGGTSAGWPADPNGSMGPNHYIQTVNSYYTIYNRAGDIVAGPTAINTLFWGYAGAENNDGDPIVLYDEQAERWLLAEFSISSANDYVLVAVSSTDDPTGTWYKYSFDVWETPDYEKFGVWRDGYYMATNTGSGPDMYVFQRSQMLIGASALAVGFDNPWRPTTMDGFLCAPPLDNDGPPAPEGEPGLFIAFNDDAIGGGSDELWIYELDADWNTPANSTFTRTQQIAVASFDSHFGDNWDNIGQLGTTKELDAIPMVIMNPPQYRNFSTYETIVCCHTVDVDQTDHAGIRWYELRRVSSGDWTIRQQGTYAPDANSRWMGSIMLNGYNEIGLGYSISSTSMYPGIRYCGQSSSAYAAANGTMDVAEQIIHTGAYSQTNYNRWGDYSGMQVDPSDDETFWYTSQYSGGSNVVKSKIANFQIGTMILTANFAVSNPEPNLYSTVILSDASLGGPSNWNWSITPSTFSFVKGTSSTSRDPKVQFNEEGDYSITLIVSNGSSYDTITKTDFITVTDCNCYVLPYNVNFVDSTMPPCWKNLDHIGLGQKWVFDNPANRPVHTPSYDNGFALLDSYMYGPGNSQNADLVTPLLDLTDYTTVNIAFQHWFYYQTPSTGRLFYTNNDGTTWNQLASWASTTNNPTAYSLDVSSYVAGKSQVRFKWNYTATYGIIWAVDDISITGTGPNTWTGAASSSWTATGNWSAGAVPTSSSNVIIPATAANWPTYSGNFVVGTTCNKITMLGASQMTVTGNFTVNPGKTLDVKGTGQLHIGGSWNNNGNFLPGGGTVHFNTTTAANVNAVTNNIANTILATFHKGMTEITDGSAGPTGNDASSNASIGFSFYFLGNSYSQVSICTNGWLSFNTSNAGTSPLNARLFSNQQPNITLAPWYDDLNADLANAITYKTVGSSPYRVFTVQWKSMPVYNGVTSPARISFQVKLYETSNMIEFHYGDIVEGTHSASESASIGIENATGGSGNYIDATTGSTTAGVSTLTTTANWPKVNYRFTPPASVQFFNDLNAEKSTSSLGLLVNTVVRDDLTITSGTLTGPSGNLEVAGDWTNNGTFTAGSSTVLFTGSSNQNIGGNTATTFYSLTLKNPSGITLQNNETVANALNMTVGNINCSSSILTLGTSSSAVGSLAYTSGNILGSFKRWIAASTTAAINFPVGTSTSNHLAKITFTNNTAGSLTVRYEPGDPGNHSGFPITDSGETLEQNNLYTEGSWSLIPTTLTSSNYALELTGTGFSSAGTPDATVRILKRPDGGGSWMAQGSHVAGTAPVAKRSGLSGFSRFMLAKPGQLPKISGNLNYYNTAYTPLNSGVTVKLYKDGSQVGTDFTVTSGTYQFLNLQPGTYEIRASSGLSTTSSVNTSDAAQVNYWAVNPYTIEKVRFYSGDVTGSDHYLNSTDALRIQSNFVNGTAFDRSSWMFWKAGETTNSNDNPTDSYPTVSVATSNVTANIYGLCTGDFNRSFVPGAVRSEQNAGLLTNREIFANPGDVLDLPIILSQNLLVGAYSLILEFPSELAEIIDIKMNNNEGHLSWAVNDNELRMSWFTEDPVYFSMNDELVSLKLKLKNEFSGDEKISFRLTDNVLNELADERFRRLDNVILLADEIRISTEGINDPENPGNLILNCHPNPADEFTIIDYNLTKEGIVTIELINSYGQPTSIIENEIQNSGSHEILHNTGTMPPGIYIVKINLRTPSTQLQKTTKLIIKH